MMLNKQPTLSSYCNTQALLGACLDSKCQSSHLTLSSSVKKKLVNRNQDFNVPEMEAPVPKNAFVKDKQKLCECCHGSPANCKNKEVCRDLGQCFCEAQKDIEEYMNNPDSFPPIDLCTCCKGEPEQCQNELCRHLGMCQCQLHDDLEEGGDDTGFFAEFSNCQCCKGHVFLCKCVMQEMMSQCLCMVDAYGMSDM